MQALAATNEFAIPQSPLIRDTVCAFWQTHRKNNPPANETIIPKGVVEFIFSFETPSLIAKIDNQVFALPKCFVRGFNTIPIHLHLSGCQTYFGVVVFPAAARHVLKTQPVEFFNCCTDLTLLESSFYSLWNCLGEQKNFFDRITVFTKWLTRRLPYLSEKERGFDNFLQSPVTNPLTVSNLAKEFCYSTKQLSRKLYELTGMNTEQTLLYKKYMQAVHLIHTSKMSLTEIAYSCHFFDQSHFIRTFKSLSHFTPHEYRQRKSDVPGHIFMDVP